MTETGQHAAGRRNEFGFKDILWRFGVALLLVLVTYNPSGFSYLHWVREALFASELGPLHILMGALLIAGWAVYIVATRRSLGIAGLLIGAGILAALVWLVSDFGLLSLDSASAVAWVVLFCLAALLALGMCWSHVWRRMSGQLEVDDVDS